MRALRPAASPWGRAFFVLGIALAIVVPLILSRSQLTIYVLFGTATIVTLGISVLMGYAGQVSLGQAAFYGIGAYTAALLSLGGVPPLLALICSPIVAALLALVLGIPILRLRGHYLAFATLALQIIVFSLIGQSDWLGGDLGLQGIPQLTIAGFEFSDPRSYAWLTSAVLLLAVVATSNIVSSRPGRGLRALATSETAAESSGVPVAQYRLVVFTFAGALAGLAGGIYAFFLGYIAPGSFPVLLSIEFVVMAVIGGLGTISGPIIGALLITVLVQSLTSLGTVAGMPSYAPNVLSYAVYAVLLVVVLLFLPKGLVPAISGFGRRLFARRTRKGDRSDGDDEAVKRQSSGTESPRPAQEQSVPFHQETNE